MYNVPSLGCCFNSTVHYIITPTLPLEVECASWPLPLWDPIIPIAFSFPNSVTSVSTKVWLQMRVLMELFKDAETAVTNFLLIIGTVICFLDPPIG